MGAMLALAAGIGIFSATNSVFVRPICESLGLARGKFTLYRTIISLVSVLCMPLYTALIKKFGAKKVMIAGALGIATAVAGYATASSLWQFYLLAVLEGLFTNGISFITVTIVINAWFIDQRGTASGIAYAGSGLGGAICTPIVSSLIEKIGWRGTYLSLAAVGLAILLPVILFVIKNSPKEKGLEPYQNKKEEMQQPSLEPEGVMLKQAPKSGTFWLLMAGFFSLSLCVGGPYTHTVAYFTDIGYHPTTAAAVMSLYMIFLTLGKVLLGGIFDRFGSMVGTLFVGFGCIGGMAFALFGKLAFSPWLYAIFLGCAGAGCSVAITVLVHRYFGTKDFSSIFSVMSMASTLGTALSVPFMGVVYDSSGSYAVAWIALLALAVLTAFCLVGANLLAREKSGALEAQKVEQ